ncbi:CWF19-like protein 1 [Bacillus rossius redtenbacheri]|uniref:CWF19-like protein 1 n=1 Tax=Bacillus rossius redtenbacheri TaxID=93214 RepID=UPI002FDF0013
MSGKSKILVCGDVNGKFKTLFTKVERVNKKQGPFAFLLCVGNFFGDSADNWKPYHDGKLTVPITTYILGPRSPEQLKFFPDINGCELATNVSYLGKRGVITTSSGLRVAYVSGAESDGKEHAEHLFSDADVTSVRDASLRGKPSFRGVDILASSAWPKDIVHVNVDLQQSSHSWKLSWLANQIKPRYYFCPSNTVYYERPPYSNHNSSGDTSIHATRFIAVAEVGNASDQKWLYAANLEPIDKMSAMELYQATTDQTECPFSGNMLLHNLNKTQVEHTSQFFYDMNPPREDDARRKRSRNDDGGPTRKQRPVFDQDSCWFCLSSADVEKHLVISIGEEAYLALAKGGLVPDHLLILPVTHHQSLSDVPEAVTKEIKKFKSALKSYFRTQNKVPVFYERNYKTSHLQIQVVPIDIDLSDRLKEVFQESAEAQGFELDELPPHSKLDQIAPPGTPYFYAELPTGEKLFHRVKKNFPLQFGREVLASSSLLDMEDRSDWRDCKIPKEEETEQAKQFRNAFQKFDFTV